MKRRCVAVLTLCLLTACGTPDASEAATAAVEAPTTAPEETPAPMESPEEPSVQAAGIITTISWRGPIAGMLCVMLASLLTEGQIPTILESVQFCEKGGSANG